MNILQLYIWAQPQYMPLKLDYPGLKCVHDKPPIYTCDDFLSLEECTELIQIAAPLLQRSKTHAVKGSEATKGRTSLTCHLPKKQQPCPSLLQKIQQLTGKPYGHMELPQVARYTDGQRYVEHYDGVDPHTEAGRAFCANGGQRIATVLMYLNDDVEGGETYFKRLEFRIKPKKGMAVIFFPGLMNGELDHDALHAGLPPVGIKWVSQVWIRQSFREDGQPSSAVPLSEQTTDGPLHEGIYMGQCLEGDELHQADMTFRQALEWAKGCPDCQGFTFEHELRRPEEVVRVVFKSHLRVLTKDGWWTYSLGPRG